MLKPTRKRPSSLTCPGNVGSFSPARYKGKIIASLDGNVLTGFWIQPRSAVRCGSARRASRYWGRMRLSFSEYFTAFRGAWSYCDGEPSRGWSGNRQ